MNEVTLWEAWKLWLSGHQVHDSLLWGVNILWWGRIGKLIQLLAALTIIAEIIGPQRLRSFGNSMHATFTLKKANYYLRDAMQWIQFMLRFVLTTDSKKEKEALEASLDFKANIVNLFTCLALILLGIYLVWPYWPWWLILLSAVLGYLVFLVSLSPIVTVLVLFIFTLGGLVIDSLLIEPLAWMIERQDIDKWVKIGSLLLFLLGFHFDLLSS